MRLSFKILIALVALAAILGAGLVSSMTAARRLEHTYTHAVEHAFELTERLRDLRVGAMRIVSAATDTILEANLDGRKDAGAIDREVARYWRSLDEFAAVTHDHEVFDPSSQESLARLGDLGGELELVARQIQFAMSVAPGDRRVAEQQERLRGIEQALVAEIAGLLRSESANLAAAQSLVGDALLRQRMTVLVCAAAFLAALAVIGVMAQRVVIVPLERLRRAAIKVGRGEFERPPEHASGDEIGILTGAFRRMVGEIEELVATATAGKAAVEECEARFRDFAEASSDWLWETDAEGRITFLSDRFEGLTGHAADEVLGVPLDRVMTPVGSGRRKIEFSSQRLLRNFECTFVDTRGVERRCRLSGRAVTGPDGAFVGYRGTATDITDEVAAIRRAEYLSLHDPLTGLPNRMLFTERLSEALEARAQFNCDVAVLFLDLDRFKEVNDTMGHEAGDALLTAAAARLTEIVAPSDTVARFGGDEFAIVQTEALQPDAAEMLCREIIRALSLPIEIGGKKVVIGCSIGVALASKGAATEAGMLRDSDIAMYRAKADGRGLYRFHDDTMNRELQHRRDMEDDLREAIAANELVLHYQPLYDTRTRTVVGVEALLRWFRPGRPPISPAEFIPLAEETGLILPLGEWVLRTACQTATTWPDLFVSVNLSPLQFLDEGLLRLVSEVLAKTGLEPARLELEITENVLLEQTDAALFKLDALRDLGVRLVIDDFGTGYASLSYLQRFLFDKIKLDRSFITKIEHSGHAAAIVRAVLQLGRALGVETLAEGVETERQIAILANEGCDQLQGFYFSRALPRDELTDLLEETARSNAPPGPA